MMQDDALIAGAGTAEAQLLRQLDKGRLPRHVAVIMDGNGRWAKQRHRPRIEGHRVGTKAVREVVEASARLGIEILTLYAFSTENWQRPRHEVWTLMNLIREHLGRERERLIDNGIRLRILGRRDPLPADLLTALDDTVRATAGGERMTLNIALNYSGRAEIVDAVRRIAADAARLGEAGAIDEKAIERQLCTAGQPDPDLLIRTSGEMRVSNFLLWQIAYSEIWLTPTLWPDFGRRDLLEALIDYQRRERRFGQVGTSGIPAASLV